jgi:hypothetical protein
VFMYRSVTLSRRPEQGGSSSSSINCTCMVRARRAGMLQGRWVWRQVRASALKDQRSALLQALSRRFPEFKWAPSPRSHSRPLGGTPGLWEPLGGPWQILAVPSVKTSLATASFPCALIADCAVCTLSIRRLPAELRPQARLLYVVCCGYVYDASRTLAPSRNAVPDSVPAV